MASRELQKTIGRRIIDQAGRLRRQRKALEALEQDNFQDDPHANLNILEMRGPGKRRKARNSEYFKQRFRKTFVMLLEEEQSLHQEPPNYQLAEIPPSRFPKRRFCSVCGFLSHYTCISCGTYYCGLRCLNTHQDTRCLKWMA